MESKIIRGFRVIGRSTENEFTPSPPTLGVQQPLFLFNTSQSLIFVHLTELTDEQFIYLLNSIGPAIILELREAPRFDVGHLDRKTVFEYFDKTRSVYCDLTAREQKIADLRLLIYKLDETISRFAEQKRPFLCLVGRRDNDEVMVTDILRWIAGRDDGKWTTYQFPDVSSSDAMLLAQ